MGLSQQLSGAPISPMDDRTAAMMRRVKESHAREKAASTLKREITYNSKSTLARLPQGGYNTTRGATGPTGRLAGPTGIPGGNINMDDQEHGAPIPTHSALGDYNNDIPDLLEPIIGYRAWTVDATGKLLSANSTEWEPRQVHHAECKKSGGGADHRAPDLRCTCGMYAAKEPEDMQFSKGSMFVWGRSALWGRVIIHAKGYRAEYCYPVSLNLVVPPAQVTALGQESAEDLADLIAARYGCPVRVGRMGDLYTEHKQTWDKLGLPPQVKNIIG